MQKMFVANKGFILNEAGEVLLVRDSGKMDDHKGGEGTWDLPGGRMDKEDKTLEEGLVRELKEEIGYEIDISTAEIISTSLWSIAGDDDRRVAAMVYLIRVQGDLPVILSDEYTDYGWFAISDIEHKTASPCLKKVIVDYLEKYAQTL